MRRLVSTLLVSAAVLAAVADASAAGLRFVPQPRMTLKGFWAEKLDLLERNWMPHCWRKLGVRKGAFQDNLAEASMLALERHPERKDLADAVEKVLADELADQSPDGYVGRFKDNRYADWTKHEFYRQGYFLEAAVRHMDWTQGRDRRWFDAGRRLVDHLDATFGPAPKRTWTDGHPGLEKALLTFADAQERWEGPGAGRRAVDLARHFILHQHDIPELRHAFCQSDEPATRMKEVRGHAVRATYFYAAMAGVAARGGDRDLAAAANRLFANAIDRKSLLTGGVGARWAGEAFGHDYSLGNERAYAEGCAACGMYDWCTEMTRLKGVGRAEDVRERLMYNVLLGVFSSDFTCFAYQNPPASATARQPWHSLPCCSGNVPRVLEDYKNRMYAVSADGARLHLLHFLASTGGAAVVAGVPVTLDLETDYPRSGAMKLVVTSERPVAFDLEVRFPDRAESALYLAEPVVDSRSRVFAVTNAPANGNRSELAFELPMPVQKVTCAGLASANRGLVAEQRGPLVTAFEGTNFSVRVPYHDRLNRGGASRVWLPADGAAAPASCVEGDFFRGTGQPIDAKGRKIPKTAFLQAPPAPAPLQKLSISFEQPVSVARGAYGRVHAVGPGRHALVYEADRAVWFRVSADGCRTWGDAVKAVEGFGRGTGDGRVSVYPANPEILRLKNGRLLLPFNWRPLGGRADLHPYEIALVTSDDDGRTWSAPRTLYSATNVTDGVVRGCYEPFAEERDGEVRIYFADETPYVDGPHKYQNISCVASRDGGDTWDGARVFCYKPRARDGMPVALRMGGRTYLAIESNGGGRKLHPEIVRDDGVRMQPLLRPDDWRRQYAGAPYLAETANYVLLSCQSSVGSADPSEHHAVCEVFAMAKNEMVGGLMQTFRAKARPIAADQTKEAVYWNALCPLEGDDFLVVSQYRGHIYLTRGHVETLE